MPCFKVFGRWNGSSMIASAILIRPLPGIRLRESHNYIFTYNSRGFKDLLYLFNLSNAFLCLIVTLQQFVVDFLPYQQNQMNNIQSQTWLVWANHEYRIHRHRLVDGRPRNRFSPGRVMRSRCPTREIAVHPTRWKVRMISSSNFVKHSGYQRSTSLPFVLTHVNHCLARACTEPFKQYK